MHENKIGDIIVQCAINLHRELGSGLLEVVYQVVLARELETYGLKVEREVPVAIEYKGIKFDQGFRADLIVEKKVIVVPRSHATTRPDAKQTGSLKSVDKVSAAHKKQLLTYLRLNDLKLGYLLNFGDALMKDGISRIINGQL